MLKHKVTCLGYICTCKSKYQESPEENTEINTELEENNLEVEEDCHD